MGEPIGAIPPVLGVGILISVLLGLYHGEYVIFAIGISITVAISACLLLWQQLRWLP